MKPLMADMLKQDPRVAQAKSLLRAAMADAQSELTTARASDPGRRQSYEDLVGLCAELRGGSLYYPYLGSGFGRGPLVELADGSVKYDFISGIGPHFWGHCHPDIVAAEVDAALTNTVMQGHLQQNTDAVTLMARLRQLAGAGGAMLNHCFLSTSGAMANENALKVILQKQHPRSRLLCFQHCFAGRTLALAMLTDKAAYRSGLPTVVNVDYIPFYDHQDPDGSTARSLAVLKSHLQRFPQQHAAMCLELVQGEAGYYPGTQDFFAAIIDVLKSQQVAIWCDEIQTFGRLSRPFAFQHFHLDDVVDVVTVGKLSQVCATLFTTPFKPRRGLLSQTFTASTSAIAASQVILDALADGDFYGEEGRIACINRCFSGRLEQLATAYPDWLHGPFGIGAMIACNVGDGSLEISKAFAQRLFNNGVIAFIAGHAPVRLRFLPPVGGLEERDVHAACDILETTLQEHFG